ncbi:acetylhydrolase [Nocardiopsis sp. MG754419]|uniref:alpha/beta hydrolase family protein n=1 Tax=Nocardiopsis sp. MG754419 TaxID=2259865 RepID=UPI001BA9546C|nr:acetylhydrolase [Nocardiopsis sp. MG754419]MBR8742998.1 acetylhydrolase [Nocardiopsis sp. MG754419]
MQRPHRTIGALAGALSLATVAACGAESATLAGSDDESPAPRASLPAPTGEHPVGSTTHHLVDHEREDPWAGGDRELMVTLWYPTPTDTGERAPYLTEAEAEASLVALGLDDLPVESLVEVGTHSAPDVEPIDGELPLVLFSPGAGVSRVWATSLAEELASHGFAVAGIDHRHEAAPVEFPDGLVEECTACVTQDWDLGGVTRAADVGFLLDEIDTGALSAWSAALDTDAVGMIGHSWGGTAVAQSLLDEERVAAGINLDGPYHASQLEGEIDRPLALLTNDQGHAWEGWDERWDGLTGDRRWIRVTDSGHSNALDRGVLMDRLDLRDVLTPEQWRAQFGDLDPEHGVRLVRDYSTGYFDHHLRGGAQPIVDDPQSVHPELVVVDPEG